MPFKLFDENNAPEEAREGLALTKKNLGTIPNLERVLAAAPPALNAYAQLWDLFEGCSLSPAERHVVYLTANYENECNYCVPWHTYLAEEDGVPTDVINALTMGISLPDARLDALRTFTRSMIANRGKISEGELQQFFTAGFTEANALEVILGLACKTMSNYTNSIAGTPLDKAMHARRWAKPNIAMADD